MPGRLQTNTGDWLIHICLARGSCIFWLSQCQSVPGEDTGQDAPPGWPRLTNPVLLFFHSEEELPRMFSLNGVYCLLSVASCEFKWSFSLLGGLQISLAMQENHRWSKLERKEKPVYEPVLTEGNTEKQTVNIVKGKINLQNCLCFYILMSGSRKQLCT